MKMTLEQMLAELLESVTREIKAAGRQDEYCSITVAPGGDVAYDFDGDCKGIAWVTLISANPSVSFPVADLSVDSCAYSLAFTVEVGMIGPAPVLEDHLGDFQVPSDVDQFEASMKQARELQLMHRALQRANIPEKVIGAYAPVPPNSGVMGGTWTISIGGED